MHKFMILLPLLFSMAFAQESESFDSFSTKAGGLQLGEQLQPRQHPIYVDFGVIAYPYGGSGWTLAGAVATINYEWEVYQTSDGLFSARVRTGIGGLGEVILGSPLAISGLVGRHQHHLDMSLGAFIGFIETTGSLFNDTKPFGIYGATLVAWPIIEAGYRYQRPEGGLLFRAKVGTAGLGVGLGWAF
ncbi:MAG: hypothetical protein AB8H47_07130 [Bacteroidia bacterium]